MEKKPATSKAPASLTNVMYRKLTQQESRVLAVYGQAKKTDQMPRRRTSSRNNGECGLGKTVVLTNPLGNQQSLA
jgi:hypothetical protein